MISPLVSVIVATYRQSDSLKNTLCSLLAQTYSPIEVLVIDDNSELVWNETVTQIIENLSANFNEKNIIFQYIQNKSNMGSAETRNIGIRCSTGRYITFLDDDDVYTPEKIEHQVTFMEKQSADFSITDIKLVDQSGKIIEYRKRNYLHHAKETDYLALHLMHHMSGTDTLMFSRNYLLDIGGFPPINLGDEFYLMLNAILAGGKLCYLPECGVIASVHEGESGLSSGMSKLKCENDLYALKKLYFSKLKKKEVRCINMRHHAVLAFAEIRMNQKRKFFTHAVNAFIASPVDCMCLIRERIFHE